MVEIGFATSPLEGGQRVKDVQRGQALVATILAAGASTILWIVLITGADWLFW